MRDWKTVDFFSDAELVDDPYPYFDQLRRECPVLPLPNGVVAVTGFEEASEVYLEGSNFSSCNSVIGPFAQFPVPLEGDDVGEIIDRYRDQLPDERAHGHHGSPGPHPRAGTAHAADHFAAAQGERGVHVPPVGPAPRRVRGRWLV